MRSAEAEKLNEILRTAPKAVDMALDEQREAGEHQEDMTSEPDGVTFEDAAGVGGLWATAANGSDRASILYLYGGGYVISSPQSRRKTAGHLARASGGRALVPRYRLAPEHPFPAAVEDGASAYRWLLDQGAAPERTVIAGDSSAGGLAVAVMLKLREEEGPLPAGGVLISPWVDLACSGETMRTRASVDLTCTQDSLERMAGQYLDGKDPRTPLASPLYAELAGLPPMLAIVGGDEILLDDSVRLARSAGTAEVEITVHVRPGMQHIFPVYCGFLPEADDAVAAIGAWIGSRVGARA